MNEQENSNIINEENKENEKYLLPSKAQDKIYLKTLILDLDETLVHGQNIPFTQTKHQKILQCKLNNIDTTIYVKIRPGVKEFLRKMSKIYEIIIFTASVEDYAKLLIDLIDTKNFFSYKLFREQCSFENNIYIKDLKKLGRDLKDVIIIDNSPNSYIYNKENGIPISTWFDDENDRELYNITQIMEFLSDVDDVRVFIPKFVIGDEISYLASGDIIRKFKNKNFKNNNMSAMNFHPFINDSSSIINNTYQLTNNHSIIEEKEINNDTTNKIEKDLIDISQNYNDIMLNENINKTDLDINIKINDDLNLLTEENNIEKIVEVKDKIDIENKDVQNKNDIKSTIIKDEKENKKINTNSSNNDLKNNKNNSKTKIKTSEKNNNNKRKIKHTKSSSDFINTVSTFNILMPNNKTKKEKIIKNRKKLNVTKEGIKSKTVKKQNKILTGDKSKKKFYSPRNIINEFKPLRILNTSFNNSIIRSKLKVVSDTPKKQKKIFKNKVKERLLSYGGKNKEKIKSKEEYKSDEMNKKQKNTLKDTNKKDLIKQRKKTPFRVHPKKEKNKEKDIINITIKREENKEENKIINNRKIINNISIDKNKIKKENDLVSKDKEPKMYKTINSNNNHKNSKSTKHFHINNKIENRLPWGWGGYTIKLSDFDNMFNYNVESRELRIAKLDLNSFKRAKSCKPLKGEKNKNIKEIKENNTKIKRGIISSYSTNKTTNKNEENNDLNI